MKKTLSIISVILILALCASIPVFAANKVNDIANLHQTEADTNSVKVSWSTKLTAQQYVSVELSLDKKNWEKETDYAKEDENIMGLSSGTTYYVRARMRNGDTYGKYTSAIAVTTQCSEVKGLKQIKATKNSATFKWDASSGATSYKVCRWLNNQEYVDGTTTSTTYTIKGLKNTTEFSADIYVKPIRKIDNFVAEPTVSWIWNVNYLRKDDVRLVPKKLLTPKITTVYSFILSGDAKINEVPFGDNYQYIVYNYKGNPIQKSTTSSTNLRINTIKRNQFYKIRARAYNTVNKKTNYGPWSDYNYYANSTDVHAKRTSNKKAINISWKKVKGATSYSVYVSKGYSTTGAKKVKTTKSLSYKLKKYKNKAISKKAAYTIYVVANKKVGKKTYKSYSNVSVNA